MSPSAAPKHRRRLPLRLLPPDRRTLWFIFALWAAATAATVAALCVLTISGTINADLGGDFVAFHGAAKAAAGGDAAEIYNLDFFSAHIKNQYPDRTGGMLSWQYPPTYFLIVLPFAALGYLPAFALWSAAAAGGYVAVLRMLIKDRLALFAIIAGPAACAAFLTGQNGFFTAALIALAAFFPKSRPILAGVAAGLLTVKPHLGLLIPVAYIAAGCWRAMTAAAITALTIAALSLALFGADAWAAFFHAISETSQRLRADALPLGKMASPMSAALYAAAPRAVAIAFQLICTASAAAFVWRVWRREQDAAWRACALIAATLLASPYSFHYELIILALPTAIIALRGARRGWLKHERAMIVCAYAAPALWGAVTDFRYGISVSFVAAVIVFALVYRRTTRRPA